MNAGVKTTDGSGAVRSVERIVTGLKWRAVQPALVVTGTVGPEDLAATMLATTLGVQFDPDKAWDEREQQYKMSGEIVQTHSYVRVAPGAPGNLWTSVISSAVFIL